MTRTGSYESDACALALPGFMRSLSRTKARLQTVDSGSYVDVEGLCLQAAQPRLAVMLLSNKKKTRCVGG